MSILVCGGGAVSEIELCGTATRDIENKADGRDFPTPCRTLR